MLMQVTFHAPPIRLVQGVQQPCCTWQSMCLTS